VEWLIADMGILAAAAVTVPLHAPLTARQIEFQLSDGGVSWLFVSGHEQLQKAEQIQDRLPGLRDVWAFDAARDCDPPGREGRRPILRFSGFLQHGRQALRRAELDRRERALTLESLATIMYTSGTTGNPKGVMLTHGNLLSNSVAMDEACPRPPDSM